MRGRSIRLASERVHGVPARALLPCNRRHRRNESLPPWQVWRVHWQQLAHVRWPLRRGALRQLRGKHGELMRRPLQHRLLLCRGKHFSYASPVPAGLLWRNERPCHKRVHWQVRPGIRGQYHRQHRTHLQWPLPPRLLLLARHHKWAVAALPDWQLPQHHWRGVRHGLHQLHWGHF